MLAVLAAAASDGCAVYVYAPGFVYDRLFGDGFEQAKRRFAALRCGSVPAA
jgi:hypothetical protein